MRLLNEDEELNPMSSAVNLVDVFLVIIAALLIALAQNPLSVFSSDDVTVIKNAGKPNMEVIVKKGKEIKEYKSTGEMGSGEGSRAGVAYKMADGSFVYVPEDGDTKNDPTKNSQPKN
ncbi:DUF2149 domain-containing protein [Psychrosphaera sp. B3R10]|uniref:DUF2149 domain-containing protein n=1 Tax=unclassified Psychrosphaera TaxID=2641570 RepID=UPI001C0927A4|nr:MULTISPECIES: DUF2149 domain-containing protein [unclassified Psychrosphaera]MBU2880992.1 DUF2149 domain-containing protein [Psychrosphaera sp. I2R16]MBU2990789.1 DUF2149 domain-containing protein [Psychrosphaera sp. B3R10]MDO6720485.1 DUF2149 domain-containing protein [Psychrosphaera sp. 1_MG-2023]